jgi:hypothetical protein
MTKPLTPPTIASTLAAVLLFIAAPAPAAETTFQYARTIQTDPRTREELVAVPLDSHAYAATRDNLADLRITDEADRSVPFLIRRQIETRPRTVRTWRQAHDMTVKPLPTGELELTFGVDPDQNLTPPDGFTIITPLRDFEQRVDVFAADRPDPLVAGALIFDYARFMDFRMTDVSLPQGGGKRFRIVIQAPTSEQASQLKELTRTIKGGREESVEERRTVTDRPFRIDRIDLWWESTSDEFQKERLADSPPPQLTVTQDPDKSETVIAFSTSREPLSQITVETTTRNFSRAVTVEAEEPGSAATHSVTPRWVSVGSATISRYSFRSQQQERLQIPISPGRRSRYRLRIADRDNAPLDVTALRLQGGVDELVFLAEPQSIYRLQYGADLDRTPDFDVAPIQNALSTGAATIPAQLTGPVPSNLPTRTARTTLRDLLNDPWIWGAIVVILGALLAFGLFRAGQKIQQTPDEPT